MMPWISLCFKSETVPTLSSIQPVEMKKRPRTACAPEDSPPTLHLRSFLYSQLYHSLPYLIASFLHSWLQGSQDSQRIAHPRDPVLFSEPISDSPYF